MTPRVISATTIINDDVRNSQGEKLGKIEEVMLDTQSNRIAYAVLEFDEGFFQSNKLFAIPWEMLTLDTDDHEMVLDVNRETLENAPGFDKDNWPNFADTSWQTDVHKHYGREPYWNSTTEPAY